MELPFQSPTDSADQGFGEAIGQCVTFTIQLKEIPYVDCTDYRDQIIFGEEF